MFYNDFDWNCPFLFLFVEIYIIIYRVMRNEIYHSKWYHDVFRKADYTFIGV